MAGVLCTEVPSRPTEFLACTSLPRDALQALVPPCEAAFQAPRAAGRLAGKPRTARRLRVDQPCPLPPPAERRCCLRPSLQTSPRQVGQGRLCGLRPSHAHPWMHVLLPARLAALRALGAAPTRSRTALAQRLGGSAADAAPVGAPLAAAAAPWAPGPAAPPASPLVPMTAPPGVSSAPKTLRPRPQGRVARQRPPPSKRCGGSLAGARSLAGVTPGAAASRRSAWPPRRRLLDPPGAGWGRLWAAARARSPTWRSSGRPRPPAARPAPGHRHGPPRPGPSADGAWSLSTVVSRAVASAKTGAACGRWASVIW